MPDAEQLSAFPAPGEPGVVWRSHHQPGAPVTALGDTAWAKRGRAYAAAALCPGGCSSEGLCKRVEEGDGGAGRPPRHACACFHGFSGDACQDAPNSCPAFCSGRGACWRGACACRPGWSGLGCEDGAAEVAAALGRPSVPRAASALRVHVLPLPAWLNTAYLAFGTRGHSRPGPYGAAALFLDRLLNDSAVRTPDPREANAFLVPVALLDAVGNTGAPGWLVDRAVAHVRGTWPRRWARALGGDHILWAPGDRGYCDSVDPGLHHLLWVTHYVPDARLSGRRCYLPALPPVVAPGVAVRMALDGMEARRAEAFAADGGGGNRSTVLFFAGSLHGAHSVRAEVHASHASTPGFSVGRHVASYSAGMRGARFCLDAEGYGWDKRLLEAASAGCVPLIIANTSQPGEDVLDYPSFSVRLARRDIPGLAQTLAAVGDARWRALQAAFFDAGTQLLWGPGGGGGAYGLVLRSIYRRVRQLAALERPGDPETWGLPPAGATAAGVAPGRRL